MCLLLSLESQTVVFQLRKFKKFGKLFNQVSIFGAKCTIFLRELSSDKDDGGRRNSQYTVGISILRRFRSLFGIHRRTKTEQRSLLKRMKLPLLPVSRYLNRPEDFPTMVSVVYKCPYFYFPRVSSLRITFVDHRYSLTQARKERLKSQKSPNSMG